MERDIVAIDCGRLGDRVTYYRCCSDGESRSGEEKFLSWREGLAPRLAAQAAGYGTERAVLVLLWDGLMHFDALLLESRMPQEERDAMARVLQDSVMDMS